ncbi:MAG: hypothetical protein MRJ93_10980 [Nitrososphaeraceae archaeon]|nr:hypothetical protein [Nitrososphaeraceae archaeon]
MRLNSLSKIAKIIEKQGDFLEILEFYEFCKEKLIDKNTIEYIMDKGKDISQLTTNCDKLVQKEQDASKKV